MTVGTLEGYLTGIDSGNVPQLVAGNDMAAGTESLKADWEHLVPNTEL